MKKKDYTFINTSSKKSCGLTAVLAMFALGALFSLAKPAEVKADDEYLDINVSDNGQVNASEINAALASSAQKDVRLIFNAGDTITLDMDQDLAVKTITTKKGSTDEQYCNLIIKGNKTLTVDTKGSKLPGASAIQDVNDLTITGGTIIATSEAGTINVKKNFTMDGGSLTSTNTGSGGISSTTKNNSPGIFTMNGGSVHIISNVNSDKWSTGVAYFNKVTVNGGSLSIDVKYSGTESGCGATGFLECRNIEIKDGTVDVTADGSPGVGIYATDKLSITGGKVSAKATTAAILVGKVGEDTSEKELDIADGMTIVKPAEGGLGEAHLTIESKSGDYKVIATKPNGNEPAMEVEMIMAAHSITVTSDGHGTAKASPSSAVKGKLITLSAYPDDGYRFKEWEVVSGDIKIQDDSFTMPDENVVVKACFIKKYNHKPRQKDEDNEEEPAPSAGNDVNIPDGFDELRGLLNNAAYAAKTTGLVQTVSWNKSTSLPADVMKMLHDNPNVTLVFSYTYQGVPITLTIPGSSVILNPAVEWYGPAYLYALYGNGKTAAFTTNTTASTGTYTVKSGDTLSGIAKRLKTTVKHLKDVNNIKDIDKIKPGMVLKY